MTNNLKITAVVAMTTAQGIGLKNQLPWHIPSDLAFFKRVTMNKPIVMGRVTHESIGRPLPGRDNWVLSRSITGEFRKDDRGVFWAGSLSDVESYYKINNTAQELMLVGGAGIYAEYLNRIDKFIVTWVRRVDNQPIEADAFFPVFNWEGLHSSLIEPERAEGDYFLKFVSYDVASKNF